MTEDDTKLRIAYEAKVKIHSESFTDAEINVLNRRLRVMAALNDSRRMVIERKFITSISADASSPLLAEMQAMVRYGVHVEYARRVSDLFASYRRQNQSDAEALKQFREHMSVANNSLRDDLLRDMNAVAYESRVSMYEAYKNFLPLIVLMDYSSAHTLNSVLHRPKMCVVDCKEFIAKASTSAGFSPEDWTFVNNVVQRAYPEVQDAIQSRGNQITLQGFTNAMFDTIADEMDKQIYARKGGALGAEALASEFEAALTKKFPKAVGKIPEYKFKLWARTEGAVIQNDALMRVGAENEMDGKQWVAIIDNVTRQGHIDNDADGVIPVGATFSDGSTDAGSGSVSPFNCRCVCGPALLTEAQKQKLEAASTKKPPKKTTPKKVEPTTTQLQTTAPEYTGPRTSDDVKTLDDLSTFSKKVEGDNLYTHGTTQDALKKIKEDGVIKGGRQGGVSTTSTKEKVGGQIDAYGVRAKGTDQPYVIIDGGNLPRYTMRDVVSADEFYPEVRFIGDVPLDNVVKIVDTVTDATGFAIREDQLAKYALDNQGLSAKEIDDLPKKYRKWFKLADDAKVTTTDVAAQAGKGSGDLVPFADDIEIRARGIDSIPTSIFDELSDTQKISVSDSSIADSMLWKRHLTDAQKDAITQYTGADYRYINNNLRRGWFKNPDLVEDAKYVASPQFQNAKKLADELTAYFDEMGSGVYTASDMTVYRGLRFIDDKGLQRFLAQHTEGTVASDAAFMSTTMDRKVAESYFGDDVILEIKVGKGTKVAPALKSDEAELIFRNDSALKIGKVTKDADGRIRIQAELLNSDAIKQVQATPEADSLFNTTKLPKESTTQQARKNLQPFEKEYKKEVAQIIKEADDEIARLKSIRNKSDEEKALLIDWNKQKKRLNNVLKALDSPLGERVKNGQTARKLREKLLSVETDKLSAQLAVLDKEMAAMAGKLNKGQITQKEFVSFLAKDSKARNTLRRDMRNALDAVKIPKEFRGKIKLKGATKAELEILQEFVDAGDLDTLNEGINVYREKNIRSFYDKDGYIQMGDSDNPVVFLHEIGHAMEDMILGRSELAQSFLKNRTAKDKAFLSLKKMFPKGSYHESERTKPDKFFHPYIGVDYKGQASEVISMGLEAMATDPIMFAKLDPEHFDLIWEIMKGIL